MRRINPFVPPHHVVYLNPSIFQPPQPTVIGNKVWDDYNANGLQEPDEPGLPGVVVSLLDASNTIISTTTTGSDGYYKFQSKHEAVIICILRYPRPSFSKR